MNIAVSGLLRIVYEVRMTLDVMFRISVGSERRQVPAKVAGDTSGTD